MKILITLISLVALVGCASIISTNQRPITIRSTPDEAKIFVWDGHGVEVFRGNTPTTVTLQTGGAYFHGDEYVILFMKEGFENQNVTIKSEINPWYLGNIIFGGLIGLLIVDPLTGNMWTLSPRDINQTLVQKTSTTDKISFTVLSLEDVPKHLRDKMVKIK